MLSKDQKQQLLQTIKDNTTPLTIFLAFIMLVVVVSGAILFMVMVGWIVLRTQEEKEEWFEVNSQILNACFTLTAFMTQPVRFRLAVWTWKWFKGTEKSKHAKLINEHGGGIRLEGVDDGVEVALAQVDAFGAQSGTIAEAHRKPLTSTWKWVAILFCLNGQCVFQYPITVVQWAYIGNVPARPVWVIAVFLPLSFLCGAIGGIWPMLLSRSSNSKVSNSIESVNQ